MKTFTTTGLNVILKIIESSDYLVENYRDLYHKILKDSNRNYKDYNIEDEDLKPLLDRLKLIELGPQRDESDTSVLIWDRSELVDVGHPITSKNGVVMINFPKYNPKPSFIIEHGISYCEIKFEIPEIHKFNVNSSNFKLHDNTKIKHLSIDMVSNLHFLQNVDKEFLKSFDISTDKEDVIDLTIFKNLNRFRLSYSKSMESKFLLPNSLEFIEFRHAVPNLIVNEINKLSNLKSILIETDRFDTKGAEKYFNNFIEMLVRKPIKSNIYCKNNSTIVQREHTLILKFK